MPKEGFGEMLGWLGWRRRNDGFEWHQYVRTTIKLRREERRRKLEEIRAMAAEGAREAGRQGMAAGRQGVEASGHGIRRATVALWAGLGRGITSVGRWAAQAASALRGGLEAGGAWLKGGNWRGNWSPSAWARGGGLRLGALSMRAKISLLFGLLAALAGASALMQFRDLSAAWSAALAAVVALALVALAAAPWLKELGERVRGGLGAGRLPWRQAGLAMASVAALGAVAVGASWWFAPSAGDAVARITTASIGRVLPPLPVAAPEAGETVPDEITGTARVLSGGILEVSGRLVRLAEVEALEPGQACRDVKGQAWRCGQRAERFLRSLVQRRRVVCRDLVPVAAGGLAGRCEAAGRDLGREMVAEGHAFATGGFLWRTYGSEETAAQAARRGLWQGEAERPGEFRDAKWAAARKSAPGGCPIKGRITRGARVYVVPWAPDYGSVRVRTARGERWFCSEAEAQAAGFVPKPNG